MKMYIVEDDDNIINILERIIEDKNLGQIVGKSNDGKKGLEEILLLKPDIVLVDLLMPGMDGISLTRKVKALEPNIQYIMISQVSSKDMIAKAYESGIEYYISKPINAIEVETVIKKVKEKMNMKQKLDTIQSLFSEESNGHEIKSKEKEEIDNYIEGVKQVMRKIGVAGEVGSQDIIDIAKYLIETNQTTSNFTIKELCSRFTDNPKTMEQRIRRTATVGLINLANIGIEDNINEIFVEYSNGLYNFEQVKIEMDYIRGKTKKRGRVNIKKFLDGIVYYGKRL
ncbi:two-component system response regulator YcbB [Keratinibaculum paraultunense]|uniref:Two-component system response regulator YcbB n=1 Tax=Keratinibaculum paraultunense TaxID=1278232 RepID=A0A4R3KTF9_9FIRM|nr:DNA-binding domain-containing protein [Keratinibaculum paraultunense]QQY79524.1 DNA-binding domain-containing protein [Keratinibaculum paraultunense]TCS87981.1 two-component system response regulator YcbB [Keratinibaculum paraultunense]